MADVKHYYTRKLYYKKYAWKTKLELACDHVDSGYARRGLFLKPHYTWLNNICGMHGYKIVVSWRRRRIQTHTVKANNRIKKSSKLIDICQILIYLSTKDVYEKVLNNYNKQVIETTAPVNDIHADLLMQGNIIEVKDKLYYNAYRYKVTFQFSWREHVNAEITKAIDNYLHDDNKLVQDYHTTHNKSTLYLKEYVDLITIKLSLSDRIKQVTVVSLASELQQV